MAKTVLIVEDNELNMKLFRDLLEAHGYQTSGTASFVRISCSWTFSSRRCPASR